MSEIFRKGASGALVASVLAGFTSLAFAVKDMPGGPAVYQLNLAEPANAIARGQHLLHDVLMWVCVLIFIAVFAVMFYSMWAHRKSRGAKPADFHESTTVEILWTVVPFIIVVGLGIAATGEVIAQKDTSNPDITVKVTGYQWKWGYDYLKGEGEGVAFLSNLATPREQIDDRQYPGAKAKREANPTYLMEVDNPLVVPVDKKIRLVITANDVIHSYYVPRLGIKQDAIPGFVRDSWFRVDKPGVYRGACTELCGKDHAFMPIVVEAKSEADYRAWVAEKKKEMLARADDPNKVWEVDSLAARGEKVYAANCVACHQASGKGVPGAFPALEGSKVVLGKREDHLAIMLNGKAGTAMASFKGLSDTELAAVITYARNAWGNKAEDNLVQPSAVKAARN